MASDRSVVAVRIGQFVYTYELDEASMAWNQVADQIDPSFTSTSVEEYKIVLSSDGSVIAISDSEYDSFRGRVIIFALHPNDGWTKLGATIDGENHAVQAGRSIAFSADGTVIIIGGSPYDDKGPGHVRIYKYSVESQDWVQRGDTIRGEAYGDGLGKSVAISHDASVIAIGAPLNDGNGGKAGSGQARVFEFDGQSESWVQRGSDIDGEERGDRSGWSIDLSADGSIVIVGSPYNDGNGFGSGHVRIFNYEADNGDWIQRGQDIYGDTSDNIGDSVAMSADGTTIAIGSLSTFNNNWGLLVYDFDSSSLLWLQRSNNIGVAENDASGWKVSMSADGSIVGINTFHTSSLNTNSTLKIFQWTLCASPPSSMPTSTPDVSFIHIVMYTLYPITSIHVLTIITFLFVQLAHIISR